MFYTQMSAATGKDKNYIRWQMSYLDVYCATVYMLENPPAGTVIQAVVSAYCEGTAKANKGRKNTSVSNDSYESSNDGGQSRPADWDNLTKEQQFAWESQQLEALKSIFGMSGGIVRKGKKEA